MHKLVKRFVALASHHGPAQGEEQADAGRKPNRPGFCDISGSPARGQSTHDVIRRELPHLGT